MCMYVFYVVEVEVVVIVVVVVVVVVVAAIIIVTPFHPLLGVRGLAAAASISFPGPKDRQQHRPASLCAVTLPQLHTVRQTSFFNKCEDTLISKCLKIRQPYPVVIPYWYGMCRRHPPYSH